MWFGNEFPKSKAHLLQKSIRITVWFQLKDVVSFKMSRLFIDRTAATVSSLLSLTQHFVFLKLCINILSTSLARYLCFTSGVTEVEYLMDVLRTAQ